MTPPETSTNTATREPPGIGAVGSGEDIVKVDALGEEGESEETDEDGGAVDVPGETLGKAATEVSRTHSTMASPMDPLA